MSGSDVFRVGLRVGKYQLIRALAEGGFGVLWVARDINLDRELAIKFLHPHHSSNPDVVRRFLQEARSLAKLVHPGIVTVYESGEVTSTNTPADGAAFFVMELLVGETLSQRLARIGRFTPAAAMEICRQVANALQSAHDLGIVHRDLKSDNIMLVQDLALTIGERAKVLDFGIAKHATAANSSAGTHTQAGMVFGTPNYMAPEQCRSAADANHASDIYSLGCILFELLTGKPPFAGAMAELIAHHLLTPAPIPSIVQPGIPPHLDQVIAAMLAKRQEDRPASMTVIERILEEKRLGENGGMPGRRRTFGGGKLITQPPQMAGQAANPAALAAAVGAPSPMAQIQAANAMPGGHAAIVTSALTTPTPGPAAKAVAAGSSQQPIAIPVAAGSSQHPIAFPTGAARPVEVAAPSLPRPTTLNSAAGVAAQIDARTKKSSSKFFALAGIVVVGAVIAVVAVVSGSGGGSEPRPANPPSVEAPAAPPTTTTAATAPPTTPSTMPSTTTATTPSTTTPSITARTITKPTTPTPNPTAPATTTPTTTKPTTTTPATTAVTKPTTTKPTTTKPTTTKPTTTTTTTKPTTTLDPKKCQGKGCIIDGSF